MDTLITSDLNYVLCRLPKGLLNLIKNHGLYLAGGFVRECIAHGEIQDIDLFSKSTNQLNQAADDLHNSRPDSAVFNTRNAITVLTPSRVPVQFITRWTFDKPEDCARSFDFTVCQGVIWFSDYEWRSSIHPRFYTDLAARRLFYTSPERNEDAGGSLLRVMKFLKRGYNIQPASLAAVLSRIVKAIDFSKPNLDIESCIQGLLLEVDPLRIIDGIELQDEHQSVL